VKTPGPEPDPRAGGGRRLALLFALALLVRLGALAVLAPHRAAEGSSAWDFGHEAACLGESLLRGDGLSDPWAKGTGSSSWLTPPYPALLAGLMALCGGVTAKTALLLYVLQSLASAWTCVLVAQLGANLGARRAGLWGAAVLALYPPGVWNAISVVWDTTFVACGTTAALALLTHPRAFATPLRTYGVGLAWGALLLLNPAPLALLPAAVGFLVLREGPLRERLRTAAIFLLALAVVPAPWSVRNFKVLGTAALRPNFGVELRLGNNPEATGHPVPFKFHPSHVPEELALYRALGERDYARDSRARAFAWIRAEPGRFLALCAKRVQYFWLGDLPLADLRKSGSSGAQRDPKAWAKFLAFGALGVLGWIGALRWRGPTRERVLLLGSLAGFGLAYYVTHVSERYRFPIDPLLALLAAHAVIGFLGRPSPATGAPKLSGAPGAPSVPNAS
jgi:4-amino-4-deoxy-L-arabinose transferase-like glycosyltransferase